MSTVDRFEIAKLCKKERASRGLSVADLAARAGVSNRSVAIVENTEGRRDEQLYQILKTATVRRKRAWVRVLARISSALESPPEPWLNWLKTAAGISVNAREFQTIIKKRKYKAEATSVALAPGTPSPTSTWWQDACTRLKEDSKAVWVVPMGCLYSGPFTKRGPTEANSFFENFVQRLLAVIDSRLQVDRGNLPELGVQELIEGLVDKPAKYKLIVGLFDFVGRRQYPINLIRIPGWHIRLACLAGEATSITWEDVLREGVCEPFEQKHLRAITVEGDAGDCYLKGLWRHWLSEPEVIQPARTYDLKLLAATFDSYLAEDRTVGKHSILVTDELTASEIRRIMAVQHKANLVDLTASSSAQVPRYQLTLATSKEDMDWTEVLTDAIVELFNNSAPAMAELYSNNFLSILKIEGASWLQGDRLRTYLQSADFQKIGGRPFLDALKERLEAGLPPQHKPFLEEAFGRSLPRGEDPIVPFLIDLLAPRVGVSKESITEAIAKMVRLG